MPTPLKILSIGHSYVVAQNRRLVNEIARIGQGKWEVTTVAPTFMKGDLRPVALEDYDRELCHLQGIPVYLSQRIHIMTYDRAFKQILQKGWDLVHCWEEPYIFAGGQVAWWLPKKIPLVYASFQNNSKQYPPPFSWIERYSMSRATGWIAFGHEVKEALKPRLSYQNLPMRLIPPGVDINHFYPDSVAGQNIRQSLDWETSNAPIIGYLGRFVSEKGLNLLMRVLDRLETPWRALFVGSGILEDSLKSWANRYPEQVRICTNVKHDDVPQYLNAMDILVAPSQTMPNWREQFGRMLIEAMSCGVPVIGSDSGEIPYVIADAGKVVGEKDEEGWVKALSELLESPEKRQEMAEKGLARSRTHYAWSVVAQQHLDFFTELLES